MLFQSFKVPRSCFKIPLLSHNYQTQVIKTTRYFVYFKHLCCTRLTHLTTAYQFVDNNERLIIRTEDIYIEFDVKISVSNFQEQKVKKISGTAEPRRSHSTSEYHWFQFLAISKDDSDTLINHFGDI